MMRLIHWVLAPEAVLPRDQFPMEWGAPPERPRFVPDGVFSVLYSDVGKDFYERCGPFHDEGKERGGWLVRNPVSTVWDLGNEPQVSSSATMDDTVAWRWLNESDVYQVWEMDAASIKEEMKPESASIASQVDFTFLPNKGVAEFQYERLRHFWEMLDPRPIHWGVCIDTTPPSGLDASLFATWTLDVRPPQENSLIITRLRVSKRHFPELLKQVMSHARKHGVQKVEMWNLALELRDIAHTLGGRTGVRDDHLPSFKWYGKESPQDIAWLLNEKWAVCFCSEFEMLIRNLQVLLVLTLP